MPIVVTLEALDKDALVKILNEPKNALVKQYTKMMELDDVELEFTDGALEKIAQLAIERNTGARGLRSIIESLMLDIMYEIPSREDVKKCIINEEVVEKHLEPVIVSLNKRGRKKKEESA